MPVVPVFNGFHISYQYVAPVIEGRASALACEVKRGDVPSRLLEDIERTVRIAARQLGLDPVPRVRWLPTDTSNVRGIVFDDALSEVWVRVQDRDAATNTALHELKHVHQLRGDRYKSLGLHTMEQRQADADEFARTWDPFAPTAATPAPVGVHRQVAGATYRPAADQEAARREWERKYKPLQDATAEYYRSRQEWRRR